VSWDIAGRWNNQLVARARHTGASGGLPLDLLPDEAIAPSPEHLLLWRNTSKPPAPFNLTPFAITLNDIGGDNGRTCNKF